MMAAASAEGEEAEEGRSAPVGGVGWTVSSATLTDKDAVGGESPVNFRLSALAAKAVKEAKETS